MGGFSVASERLTIGSSEWRLNKAAAIVKILALAPGHQVHRDELVERLWPELAATSALNNFYQALHVARRKLSELEPGSARANHLPLIRQILLLDFPGGVEIDVEEFENAFQEALDTGDHDSIEYAITLYAGELLPEDRYADWTLDRRRTLQDRYVNLLLASVERYESQDLHEPAIDYLRRVIDVDPTIESAHRSLMSVYAKTGRRRLALRQFEELRSKLRTELDAEPSLATRILASKIEGEDRLHRTDGVTMADVDHQPSADRQHTEEPNSAERAYERGIQAIKHFAWEAAIDELSYALETLQAKTDRDQKRECEVLIALGDAQWRAGVGRGVELGSGHVPDARRTYLHAVELAVQVGDSELLARAALGVAGYCPKTTQGDLPGLHLLERALAGVEHADTEWHARVLGRLALYHRVLGTVEGRPQPGGSDIEIQSMSGRSVAIAKRLADELLYGEMLLWRNLSARGIDHLQERLAVADQVVALAHRCSDYDLLSWALQQQHEYAIQLGHVSTAWRSLAQLDWISKHNREPYFEWLASVQRSGLTLAQGRIEEADRHHLISEEIWPRTGAGNWLLFAIRREQDRLTEVSEELEFISGRLITSPFQDAHHLLYLVENGKKADAQRLLSLRPVTEYIRMSRTFDWLPTILLLTDAVLQLDVREPAPDLYDALLPYQDLDGYSPHIRYPTGAVAQYLGRLALCLGRRDHGEQHLRRSLALHREREFLLHECWDELYLAEIRIQSGQTDQRARTRLTQKCNIAHEMGLMRMRKHASRLLAAI